MVFWKFTLISVFNDILANDSGDYVILVLLDLFAALDIKDHQTFLDAAPCGHLW